MAPAQLPIRPEVVPLLSAYHTSPSDFPSTDESTLQVAKSWTDAFSSALASGPDAVLDLLVPGVPLWRDLIVLSWDLRTLIGRDTIKSFLTQHLLNAGFSEVQLSKFPPMVMQLSPDLGWINVFLTFKSGKGQGTVVVRLIPTRSSANAEVTWRAHGILMDLEELKGHPPLLGEGRKQEPVFGTWEEDLLKRSKFEDREPTVVVIGGSQCGLGIAARLRALGVDTLVLEREKRIGDSWRNRYDALCLHDPVWYDHMPYLPFPPTWPVYTPARKLANWLESYASILEIPVWLSANVSSVARKDIGSSEWSVEVDRPEGKRTLKPKHVVFALGWGGKPSIPTYPGLENFKGEVLHSSAHKTAKDHVGKKVFVIGASTSGHDVSSDLATHGVDVTMVQRGPTHVVSSATIRRLLALHSESGPPLEIADLINASMTTTLILMLSIGGMDQNKAHDKELLDGITARGFQYYDGPDRAGVMGLFYQRGGGYYLDAGACQQIIDGKIKICKDKITSFTENGIKFENETTKPADVVIWATGFHPAIGAIKALLPQEDVRNALKPTWQLDEEGEFGGLWQNSGVRGLYVHMGSLAPSRIYSKHLALRIKALEVGLLKE